MGSERRRRKRTATTADKLAVAAGRAAVLAPGGFVAGYLLGASLGRLLGGCPLRGTCEDALPVLIAIPSSILVMGIGCTLAAVRVGRWWEGVAVLASGILSAVFLVVLVGWLGLQSLPARALALGWLAGAGGVTIRTLRRGLR